MCYKYTQDIFVMRKDQKKDFYFLINEKNEEEKSEKNEFKTTRPNSSFIFGPTSIKTEEIIQKSELFDKKDSIFQPIVIKTDIKEPENSLFLNINDEKSSDIDMTDFFKKNINEKEDSTKPPSLKLTEEKIGIETERIKKKLFNNFFNDNVKFEKETIQKNQQNSKSLEKHSKIKNSILSHWETKTPVIATKLPEEKDETIKNLSISNDENNCSLVFFCFFRKVF